jgi:hypothetical protein
MFCIAWRSNVLAETVINNFNIDHNDNPEAPEKISKSHAQEEKQERDNEPSIGDVVAEIFLQSDNREFFQRAIRDK